MSSNFLKAEDIQKILENFVEEISLSIKEKLGIKEKDEQMQNSEQENRGSN